MTENADRKYSLADIFGKLNLCSSRLPGMPDIIHNFFAYNSHVNIIFWQNRGYDVYPCTKEFDYNTIYNSLSTVTDELSELHRTIARHMSYTSTHNS